MPVQIRTSSDCKEPYSGECDQLTITIPPENIDPHLRNSVITAELIKASNLMHDRKSIEFWDCVFRAYTQKNK